jgi:hypothetical protein
LFSRLVVAIRVVDSSLLIEADHREALDVLEAYLRSDPGAIAPPRVYEETVTEPRSLGYFGSSAARIEALFSNGTVRVEEPDYSDRQVSKIVDRVRGCIAKKARKPMHVVERADLQIVALAASHAKKLDRVELIFRDKALKDCLESVLNARGLEGVSVTDSSMLVSHLLSKGPPKPSSMRR